MIDYIVGDAREAVANIPTGKVSLVACSPPFIALRSYLPADHPDKDKEIGSEPNPATFLDTLLALTAEWGRVLAPWGSIAIELGDTYAGSGGAGGDYNEGGLRDGQNAFVGSSSLERRTDTKRTKVSDGRGTGIRDLHGKVQGGGANWPRAKCLALVPQLYAASLAYGRNILTGEPSPAGQWLVRNVIVWHRPNPAVGALGDKYRPSTSYITVATRSAKRWFDLTAVRTVNPDGQGVGKPAGVRTGPSVTYPDNGGNHRMSVASSHAAGAPPLDTWFDEHDTHDTWTLTTQPSQLAHYAMWPAKLAERLILSMCPAQVCNVCGEPRRRIESSERLNNGIAAIQPIAHPGRTGNGGGQYITQRGEWGTAIETLGWSDCGHDDYRPGVVLDPFCGTGTTLCVAELHGRDSIGVDIDARNRELLDRRMAEVKRNLFGTAPEMPGQESLFDGLAS